MMENIVIRLASNGFIVTYNEEFSQQDYIAYDITEVCEIVHDILRAATYNVDMSNVVTNTLPDA
jgi:hypothetical protein